MRAGAIACICIAAVGVAALQAEAPVQNWTHRVRIGAYALTEANAAQIVEDAQRTHVFGIEVDNDIPGRYESFLDPQPKLAAIRKVAEAAHAANNKAFVYIAGTECITANADKSAHSVVKDHPEWLQRKITGEPAVFTSGAAFWISPGDEDVWISPYAKDWRKIYMERVRQIAATGIDGIYVDIPYWMTHFDGWEDSWASFDDATVAAFREQTGLDARKDVKLGDFQDPNFRKWVDFRIVTLTNFMKEIRDNAWQVNSSIMVIPEIYPGIEEESVRVGADVYSMYDVVDAIAHEYEFGGGDHMASSRTQFDWFMYQVGMLTFRSFAQGKATWILNYSWDGDKNVDPREPMKTLAMSQLSAGANFWDAPGHSMGGSNDPATRAAIFAWIAKYEDTFYAPRLPFQAVGVYFSPKSRDYHPKDFLASYRGTTLLLLQQHRAFQVVTPRTLASFSGNRLILPNVSDLSAAEKEQLTAFSKRGGTLVALGQNATGLPGSTQLHALSPDPARAFYESIEKDFTAGSQAPPAALISEFGPTGDIVLDAPPTVAANFALVNGTPHIFLSNFAGLGPGKTGAPAPVDGIRIRVRASAKLGASLAVLPYLGENSMVPGKPAGEWIEFTLPRVDRGAAVWIPAKK